MSTPWNVPPGPAGAPSGSSGGLSSSWAPGGVERTAASFGSEDERGGLLLAGSWRPSLRRRTSAAGGPASAGSLPRSGSGMLGMLTSLAELSEDTPVPLIPNRTPSSGNTRDRSHPGQIRHSHSIDEESDSEGHWALPDVAYSVLSHNPLQRISFHTATAEASQEVVVSGDNVQVVNQDTALIYTQIPGAKGESPVLQLQSMRVNRGVVLRNFVQFVCGDATTRRECYSQLLDVMATLPSVGGLFAGPLFALAMVLIYNGSEFAHEMAVAGVLVWMALWWLLEVVPVAVTALLPTLMWPLLGVMSAEKVAACYCNDAMALIFGTFIMSVAVQRWGIDKRLAVLTVTSVGRRPRLLLLATMGLTAFLGCLMSNTATATMMMPLVVAMVCVAPADDEAPVGLVRESSVASLSAQQPIPEEGSPNPGEEPLLGGVDESVWDKSPAGQTARDVARSYLKGMVLATAYTCSVSGFATLTGTGPNLTFSGLWFAMSGEQIGWFQWFTFGLPLSLAVEACIFLVINVLYLRAPTELLVKAVNLDGLKEDRKNLPPVRAAEIFVVLDYALCVTLWITRKITIGSFNGWADYFPLAGNGTVAILCTIMLFVFPAEGTRPKEGGAAGTQGPRVMDWEAAKGIKWNTLILIAGGFALSAGVTASGLDKLISEAFSPLESLPNEITLLCTIGLVVLITDWLVSSNVAVATLTLPILGSVAQDMGLHHLSLMVPATIACSLSFCSPVSTPPNAIAYSTGYLKVSEMVQTGACVAVFGILLTWGFSLTLGEVVFDYVI